MRVSCCSYFLYVFFFFKQKTAYEMRISDWSSDVCSSDLWMVETGNIMGRNIASRGRSARGPVADFNLLFASRRAPKQEPPASEEASGLGEIGRASCRERVCQSV